MAAAETHIYGQRPVLILLTIGILCATAARTVEWALYPSFTFSLDPYALVGLFVVFWLFEPDRRLMLAPLLLSQPIAWILAADTPGLKAFAEPLSLGFATAAVLVARAALSRPQRPKALFILAVGLLVPVGQQVSEAFQYFTTSQLATFDHRAYLVDLSIGFAPVGLVLSTYERLPELLQALVSGAVNAVYTTMLLMMAVTFALQLRRGSARWLLTMTAFILSGMAGAAIYQLFPVAGPVYAFAAFPDLPAAAGLTSSASPLDPQFVRNGMPSLHATSAFLIVMNATGLAAGFRRVACAFAALTLLATLLKGEHYLIDLVVAVPFSVAVQSLAQGLVRRSWPGAGFWLPSGCVVFWLATLICHPEWFLGIAMFTPAAVLLTTGISLAAYRSERGGARQTWESARASAESCEAVA